MRILRKGLITVETFKCKLGYHEWVAVHWSEFKQRPRRAIFSKKGGRRKAQYYEKRYVKYYCMRCGKKRYENKENTQQCIQDGRFKPGGRDILDEFSINCFFMNTILVNPGQSLKRNLGFPIHL